MPLIRITTARELSAQERGRASAALQSALVEALRVPADDRFHLYTTAAIDYDDAYLGVRRSTDLTVVEISLSRGRTTEVKQALYRRLADGLSGALGIAAGDVFVTLHENDKDDWSFGEGVASYAGIAWPPSA